MIWVVFNGQDIIIKNIQKVNHNKWGVVRINTNTACYSFWMTPKKAKEFSDKISKLIIE